MTPEPKNMKEEDYQEVLKNGGWASTVKDLGAFEFDMLETGYEGGFQAGVRAGLEKARQIIEERYTINKNNRYNKFIDADERSSSAYRQMENRVCFDLLGAELARRGDDRADD